MGLAGQFGPGGLFVAFNLLCGLGTQQGSEGGDLDDLVLAPTTEHHMHDAKAPPDDESAAEQRLDLLGSGIGGHVEVLGAASHQQVAHRATHNVSLEARVLERTHHAHSMVVKKIGVDAVLLGGKFHALTQRRGLQRRLGGLWLRHGLAQQTADEFLDHSKRFRTVQPRSAAIFARAGAGLVATGWVTRSSSGRSLVESL